MFKLVRLRQCNDYFISLSKREGQGVYFYRLNGYNNELHEFILKYYEAARLSGVIIEGKLANPDEKNLSYYNEIMGMNFQLNLNFIKASLKKWLPRMNEYQCSNVASSIYETLLNLKQAGKNENMLKNAYIKFMCWLYYKFERIVNRLGEETPPKILYEGYISNYELLLMSVLSKAGCDILLLQYQGDKNYLSLDSSSTQSYVLEVPGMKDFPTDFNLKRIQKDIQQKLQTERLYGVLPKVLNCTNAWISGNIWEDIRHSTSNRGVDQRFFYNCYCRVQGVEDKVTYQNELYQFQQEIKNSKRNLLIINNNIEPPTMDEISGIRRNNYNTVEQMLLDLSSNLHYISNLELQHIINKAFIDVLLEESKQPNMNVNKLTNKAVYVLCWLKRYQSTLFLNWKTSEIACFILFGGCNTDNEALFCKFLSRLPVDVLILVPNLNKMCCLKDTMLYEINNQNSLNINEYPVNRGSVHMATAAYHAERELDTLMYQDSGMYRVHQFEKATSLTLQTMFEEIAILWNQELKYRPNFSTSNDNVNMPVLFSKISGIKNGSVSEYWSYIKGLVLPNVVMIKQVPNITSVSANPIKPHATEFFKNGRLLKNKIKNHSAYQYGYLKESVQDFLLEKLEVLIEQKTIKGTFQNGTEYTIISTALNLDKNVLRLIQNFDFTKVNPKLIYIITNEKMLSLEDSIYVSFLNLVGFDIVFFVPTGYQCIERYFNEKVIEEHQIGEYKYDLTVPDFGQVSSVNRQSWREKIFRKGF